MYSTQGCYSQKALERRINGPGEGKWEHRLHFRPVREDPVFLLLPLHVCSHRQSPLAALGPTSDSSLAAQK